jgi:hypothetical protein
MLDTVKLWLPTQSIGEADYLSRVPALLDNLTHHTKIAGNSVTGEINNLKVRVSADGVGILGSLCKYFLKNNIETLTRQDIQRAFEMLADTLKLPISEAYVNRADVGQNFLMNYEPEIYYPYLGESTRYDRLTQPQSICWQNNLRAKTIYNKIAEARFKNVKIPEALIGKHLLRYELKFMSRLPRQFNVSKVITKNLYDEVFYINLIDRWHKEYEAINKLKEINLNFDKMNKPKDFFNQMALLMINEIGQNEALKLVDQLKAKNCFEHKEYYSRVKADIKRLCNTYQPEQSNDLITELNSKVKQVKEHYR